MNMDNKLSLILRRLFIKFLLSQVLILAAALLGSVIATGYYKGRLAEQLASAFRYSLLSGDTRQIIYDMSSSVEKNFRGMSWVAGNGSGNFSIPGGGADLHGLVYSAAVIPVYFGEEGGALAGKLYFYYNRWPMVGVAAIIWVFILAGSWIFIGTERERIIKEYNVSMELQAKESQVVLAAQVAHDIRSPLAALGAAAGVIEMPAEQRALVEGAVKRMQGIADDLLQRYRVPGDTYVVSKPAVCQLNGLIKQVLAEKRLLYKEKKGVKIEFAESSGEMRALVEPKELQRLISNLVNNSMEALGKDGVVTVGLSAPGEKVVIEVKDNGIGVTPEILAKLGRKGETHGKAGGNGLGLYHARTAVESWGGSLVLKSEPGKGMVVSIELPRAGQKAGGRMVVLLDDDMLVHMNWRIAAKAAGVELKAYKTPEDFTAGIKELPKDTVIYIDSELGNNVKGEDIAKDMHGKGFSDLTMATGHDPEKFSHLPWLKVTGKQSPWA